MPSFHTTEKVFSTRIIPVEQKNLGSFSSSYFERIKTTVRREALHFDKWHLPPPSPSLQALCHAADLLKTSSIPVAFPTETVYGLGADSTRSEAVKGIYKAKGRPSDNPLIIHICDLDMLRDILAPSALENDSDEDLIPSVYKPLIDKFWPGPLTILLENPKDSKLAPEVTAGLKTFGVRMPNSALALTLIKLAGVPIAAPSANASTKPSPTTAEHVLHDLDGRIELILDGGACEVGLESTVVDGLCDPPIILRPGGLSIENIRACKGWERVIKGYKDSSELGSAAPRAPGMKYKHYSPKAKVILCEHGVIANLQDILDMDFDEKGELESWSQPTVLVGSIRPIRQAIKIGIVRTRLWKPWAGWNIHQGMKFVPSGQNHRTASLDMENKAELTVRQGELHYSGKQADLLATLVEIELGSDSKAIAHGLFSALRELDRLQADVIFVEGIDDEGDIGAAVMNRLRKASSEIKYSNVG